MSEEENLNAKASLDSFIHACAFCIGFWKELQEEKVTPTDENYTLYVNLLSAQTEIILSGLFDLPMKDSREIKNFIIDYAYTLNVVNEDKEAEKRNLLKESSSPTENFEPPTKKEKAQEKTQKIEEIRQKLEEIFKNSQF